MVWELGYSFHSLLETMTFRPQVANNQSLTISFYSILCLITPKPYLMLVIFFYLGFISLDSHHSQDSRGRGDEILTPLYYFHPLHKHFDFSQAITAESSPLHFNFNQEPLVFEHKLQTACLLNELFSWLAYALI